MIFCKWRFLVPINRLQFIRKWVKHFSELVGLKTQGVATSPPKTSITLHCLLGPQEYSEEMSKCGPQERGPDGSCQLDTERLKRRSRGPAGSEPVSKHRQSLLKALFLSRAVTSPRWGSRDQSIFRGGAEGVVLPPGPQATAGLQQTPLRVMPALLPGHESCPWFCFPTAPASAPAQRLASLPEPLS